MTILGSNKVPFLAATQLQHWAILLSAHNYQLELRPSLSHANADGPSRLPLPTERPVCYSSERTILHRVLAGDGKLHSKCNQEGPHSQ
jgi:hypothetical protein